MPSKFKVGDLVTLTGNVYESEYIVRAVNNKSFGGLTTVWHLQPADSTVWLLVSSPVNQTIVWKVVRIFSGRGANFRKTKTFYVLQQIKDSESEIQTIAVARVMRLAETSPVSKTPTENISPPPGNTILDWSKPIEWINFAEIGRAHV